MTDAERDLEMANRLVPQTEAGWGWSRTYRLHLFWHFWLVSECDDPTGTKCSVCAPRRELRCTNRRIVFSPTISRQTDEARKRGDYVRCYCAVQKEEAET